MDKRFFLALLLTAIVVVATPLLFPGSTPRPPVVRVTDSSTVRAVAPADTTTPRAATVAAAPSPSAPAPAIGAVAAETTTVRTARSTYAFSSRGAAPVSIVLDSYPSRRPVPRGATAQAAQLARRGAPLAHYRLALGRDTIALDTLALQPDAHGATGASPALSYRGVAAGHPVTVSYQFVPDSFIVRMRASVPDAPAGSSLLLDLPHTLASNEPDSLEDMSHLAVSFRTARGDVSSVGFSKVDSGATRVEKGPLTWVATRNKYFLVAFRSDARTPFSGLQLVGQPRMGKVAPTMVATATQPLVNGTAAFDVYAGPQDSERLQHLGSDLDQVNPYGGWLNPVVQPVATVVVKVLLWVKRTTHLNYGWVLVIFGVAIRLALWPLSQGAMRTSMKMQQLQPRIQEIQKRYADDPKRQQEAMMKVYKEHDMSPLSPLLGCLPMFIPMPILFALYHVFQNTVEFRGVSFLWLPDISLADPYYITPLLMGASMFVMSWIGLRGAPAGPQAGQAKMMSYMMPVVMVAVFWRFASGLNLYYAVQNLTSIPQQWLLARERAKQPPVPVPVSTGGIQPAVKRRT